MGLLRSRSRSQLRMISKYDFLIYYLNCWSICNKTWFDVYHHKVDCLVKRLDCSVVVHVKVTEKVKNFIAFGWHLLSCWTFCNQTWYGDVTSWAKVSCKKIGLLSSSSGSQWRLIWSSVTVSTIAAELLIKCWSALYKIRLLFSRSRWRFKTLMTVYVSYIFCTADLLATKLGLIYYYW